MTISVPDDVAEQLAAIPPRQVSAYVTEALRRRRVSDELRAALSAAGHREHRFDPKGAAQRLASRRITPEAREGAIARLAELTGRPIEEVRTELRRQAAG